MTQFDLVEQLKRCSGFFKECYPAHFESRHNVQFIINLQEAFEHASCGGGVLACGFSYDSECFMKSGGEDPRALQSEARTDILWCLQSPVGTFRG